MFPNDLMNRDLPSRERQEESISASGSADYGWPGPAALPLFPRPQLPEIGQESECENSLAQPDEDHGSTAQFPWFQADRVARRSPPRLVFRITQSCFRETLEYLGRRPPEQAGLLFGPKDDPTLVTHFIAERGGHSTSVTFSINAHFCNVWLRKFKAAHMTCLGVCHSHPAGVHTPSGGDIVFLEKLFARPKNTDAGYVLLPIVCHGRFYPYVIHQSRPHDVLIPELVLV
ncbi:hypothetical protein Mal52_13750 [Symmachiella dynata]|uniref:JAB domain-containing protein n=1 Tax=Symmachiella dynata TaxID=2527995 RepID=A0A517ZKD2_9PLAN|nr:Mov34/MPN/PAD-1 family protein [Symmachiella dynata]QDU42906.1 hypothetical protein Mal52_13750 [Symmachiella dynata]